jgi:hypothetical protein
MTETVLKRNDKDLGIEPMENIRRGVKVLSSTNVKKLNKVKSNKSHTERTVPRKKRKFGENDDVSTFGESICRDKLRLIL